MSVEERPGPPAPSLKRMLLSPCTGQSVWPNQCCPGFSARGTGKRQVTPMCQFCKYANFSPKGPGILEVGLCHYPEEQPDTPAEGEGAG